MRTLVREEGREGGIGGGREGDSGWEREGKEEGRKVVKSYHDGMIQE